MDDSDALNKIEKANERLEEENLVLRYQVEQMTRTMRRLIHEPQTVLKGLCRATWHDSAVLRSKMDFESYWVLKGKK